MSKYYKEEDIIEAIESADTFTMWQEQFAINTLKSLPTIEVSEDCISREYMLEKAQEWKNMYSDNVFARDALTMLKIEIENAPSVVPTVRKNRQVGRAEGEWLHKRMPHDSYHITGQCSICKERSRINNYCPWCGAKMKGAE